MGNPLVSVLMPCYNVEMYVEQAVDSILNQTYSNLEIILINDGSTDHTSQILEAISLRDNRVVYVDNDRNYGLIHTLNKGLALCSGKYIARMDADDYSFPTRIEKQVKYMESNSELVCVSAFLTEIYENGSEKKRFFPISDHFIRITMVFSSPFVHPCVMMRTNVIRENSLCFEERYKYAEDYYFWSRLLQYGKGYNIPLHLLRYRVLSSSQTAIGDAKKNERYEVISAIQQFNLNSFGIVLTEKERKFHYILGNSNLIREMNFTEFSVDFISEYFRHVKNSSLQYKEMFWFRCAIGEKRIKLVAFNVRRLTIKDIVRVLNFRDIFCFLLSQIDIRVKMIS